MPSFVTKGRLAVGDLRIERVHCDGHDGRRGEEEQVECESLWIVVAGRFAYRDRRRRAVLDPATALLLGAGDSYEIRHPHGGGDVCLGLEGPPVARMLERHAVGVRSLPLSAFLRFSALAARLREDAPIERLAIEEQMYLALEPEGPHGSAPTRRERAVAEVIAHELHLRIDEPLPLPEIAAAAGVSVFHACRVFARVRGTSIHQYRQSVRLRHALALVLDTTWSLARIAAEVGYANQGHMCNHFRRALGSPPSTLRTQEGLRRLAARQADADGG